MEKEFEIWFYREYERVNGYVSSGDPMMCQAMESSAHWALQAWKKQQVEIERLRDCIKSIAEMTDGDNPGSYRADDSEGCFDAVFSVATEALKTPN